MQSHVVFKVVVSRCNFQCVLCVMGFLSVPTEKDVYDESWPPKGKVVFRHVSLTYDKELDPVLKNASFIINPGEKVTTLGHLGAGNNFLKGINFSSCTPEQLFSERVEFQQIYTRTVIFSKG